MSEFLSYHVPIEMFGLEVSIPAASAFCAKAAICSAVTFLPGKLLIFFVSLKTSLRKTGRSENLMTFAGSNEAKRIAIFALRYH